MNSESDDIIIYELLAKHFAGESMSIIETGTVNHWISENNEQYIEFKNIWLQTGNLENIENFDASNALISVHKKLNTAKIIVNRFVYFKYAAAFFLLLIISGLIYFNFSDQKIKNLMVETKNEIRNISLSDGSSVNLNINSKLIYPETFSDIDRKVYLLGEAFFDIAKGNEKPFIVCVKNTEIKVVGTTFNIYTGQDNVEIIVETGKVKVSEISDLKNNILLTPGEKGKCVNSGKKISKEKNNDPNFLAWKTKRLIFEESFICDVFKTVEKVFQKEIIVVDENINKYKLTATFENQPFESVLEIIGQTLDLNVFEKDGIYQVSKK
ncbi:MAG: FecR family protein [Bacteroidota bacterium]